MTNMTEDRAELFGFMMVSGKELEEHAASDPVLKAKILRMKAMLEQICPQVDEQFWQAARQLPRRSSWPTVNILAPAGGLPSAQLSFTGWPVLWRAMLVSVACAFAVFIALQTLRHVLNRSFGP
jgi:hypothetical protein